MTERHRSRSSVTPASVDGVEPSFSRITTLSHHAPTADDVSHPSTREQALREQIQLRALQIFVLLMWGQASDDFFLRVGLGRLVDSDSRATSGVVSPTGGPPAGGSPTSPSSGLSDVSDKFPVVLQKNPAHFKFSGKLQILIFLLNCPVAEVRALATIAISTFVFHSDAFSAWARPKLSFSNFVAPLLRFLLSQTKDAGRYRPATVIPAKDSDPNPRPSEHTATVSSMETASTTASSSTGSPVDDETPPTTLAREAALDLVSVSFAALILLGVLGNPKTTRTTTNGGSRKTATAAEDSSASAIAGVSNIPTTSSTNPTNQQAPPQTTVPNNQSAKHPPFPILLDEAQKPTAFRNSDAAAHEKRVLESLCADDQASYTNKRSCVAGIAIKLLRWNCAAAREPFLRDLLLAILWDCSTLRDCAETPLDFWACQKLLKLAADSERSMGGMTGGADVVTGGSVGLGGGFRGSTAGGGGAAGRKIF